MRLNELTGYKKYIHLDLEQLISKLSGNRGHFGAVVTAKDSKYVYKIWVKDPGYERWLSQVEKHQHNPWFPKIIRKQKEVKLPLTRDAQIDTVNVVRLERLTEFDRENNALEFLAKFLSLVDPIDTRAISKKLTLDAFKDLQHQGEIDEERIEHYNSFIKLINLTPQQRVPLAIYCLNKLGYKISDFVELIEVLSSEHGDYDIKDENIMMRGSQAVITDPYGSDEDAITISDISVDFETMSRIAPDLVARGLQHIRKA